MKRIMIGNFKTHFVINDPLIFNATLQDLISRSEDKESYIEDVNNTTIYIDLPGMLLLKANEKRINIDGTFVTFRCSDILTFLNRLYEQPRIVNGQKIWKLHGTVICIVLNEVSRNNLIYSFERDLARSIKLGKMDDDTLNKSLSTLVDDNKIVQLQYKSEGKLS